MPTATYERTKTALVDYFDRQAAETWARLTSDAPVGRIRRTVRAGRDAMRAQLLDWLPADLTGRRVLDAGCGAGQFAIEAASRGASVVAIDVAQNLVDVAKERTPATLRRNIDYRSGDMLADDLGAFDHIVAMDSLIHYETRDIVAMLARLAERANRSVLFTVAPRTPTLAAMHAAGKLFPRSDRSPNIAPVSAPRLARLVAQEKRLSDWRFERDRRVSSGFYISHAHELVRIGSAPFVASACSEEAAS